MMQLQGKEWQGMAKNVRVHQKLGIAKEGFFFRAFEGRIVLLTP